VFPKSILGYF